jgi:hypothetical protein
MKPRDEEEIEFSALRRKPEQGSPIYGSPVRLERKIE